MFTLCFDGACEPVNPGGLATGGWLLLSDDGEVIEKKSLYFGRGAGQTNNVAEYRALIAGLIWVKQVDEIDALLIRGDSQLVINQLTGAWACNKDHLRALRAEALELLSGIEWKAEWIPRERNEEADWLSRHAYTAKTGKPFPERRKR